jgi:choline monooxygenase
MPDMQDAEAFDWEEHALKPVLVETWGPFIFVNHDLQAASLLSYLGDMPEQFQGYRFNELAIGHRAEYWVDANWKLFVETNVENYHEATLHPTPAPYYKDIELEVRGNYVYQWVPNRNLFFLNTTERQESQTSSERTIADVSVQEMISNRLATLFPNVDLSCTPNLATFTVVDPQGVDRTRTEIFWLVPNTEAALAPENMEQMIIPREQIHHEDLKILPFLQKSHASGHYRPGRICPTREAGLHAFQNLVKQAIAAD